WTITSPNMGYIPTPLVGIVEVVLQSDCRYGTADPIHYPQVFAQELGFLCAIRRPVQKDHAYSPIWSSPCEEDFVSIQGATISCLGLLAPSTLRPLSILVEQMSQNVRTFFVAHPDDSSLRCYHAAMQQALERLYTFPSTFKDVQMQYALVQRYWLICLAYMDYASLSDEAARLNLDAHPVPPAVRKDFMGAFTTSPDVAQKLFSAGIPVWFMRPKAAVPSGTRILQQTRPQPVTIRTEPDEDSSSTGEVLYKGLAGFNHLLSTLRAASTYRDLCRTPLLVIMNREAISLGVSQQQHKLMLRDPDGAARREKSSKAARCHPSVVHPSHVRGRDKFHDVQHEWMPPSLEAWEKAMSTVGNEERSAPVQKRRDRYLFNWLRLRSCWLYLLRVSDGDPTSVPPQWWRDTLYWDTRRTGDVTDRAPTKNEKRRQSIKQVFGRFFDDRTIDVENNTPVTWYHHRLQSCDPRLCPLIVWELFDLGFRYELLALDRTLVPNKTGELEEVMREELLARVFPDRALYGLRELPSQPSGLSASLPHQRAPYLEGLRVVVSRWPSCPPVIRGSPPLTSTMHKDLLISLEERVTLFYVRKFFECSGRAPLIPHRYPMLR
ncbi:hypothetical protein C8Q76DRAFT_607744, partial [Earliella scabrosa]